MEGIERDGRPRRGGPVRASALALVLVLTLADGARGAAPAAAPPAIPRIAALAAVDAILGLSARADVPAVEMPPGAAGRSVLARALAAGLTRALPRAGPGFGPERPTTELMLAVLAANALAAPSPSGGRTAALVAALEASGLGQRQAADAIWAERAGLVPLAVRRPTATVAPTIMHGYLARLARLVRARRPTAVRLVATAASVPVGSLDRLRPVVLGPGGRPTRRLAGEHLRFALAGGGADAAAVAANGDLLAARPGRYRVRAILFGGLAGAGLASPTLTVTAFARPRALVLRLSAATLVADGRDQVSATVAVVDAAADVVTLARGDATVTVSGPAVLETPATGAFSTERLTLPLTAGAARFTLEAPAGSRPATVTLQARTTGVAALPAGAVAVAHLAAVAPVARRLSLALPALAGGANVVAGGSVTATLSVLDQAGEVMPSGVFPLTFVLPKGVTLAPGTPAAFDAGANPAGMAVTLVLSPALAPGSVTVEVTAAGVRSARLRLRVVAAAAADAGLHLAGSFESAVVPLPALEASSAAAPADSASLEVLDAAGAPVPYAGTLVATVTAEAGGTADGIAVAVVPAPAQPDAFTLLVDAAPGRAARAGTYSVRVAAAPGSPVLTPLTLTFRLIAVPPAG